MSTYPATFISGKKIVSFFVTYVLVSFPNHPINGPGMKHHTYRAGCHPLVWEFFQESILLYIALHIYTHTHMCTATPTTSHCHCNARCVHTQALPPHPAPSSSGMTTCCNSLKDTSTQSGSYTSCMALWDSTVSLDTLYGSCHK